MTTYSTRVSDGAHKRVIEMNVDKCWYDVVQKENDV